MATAEELLAILVQAAQKTAEHGVSSFRENEDSTTFITLPQYATLIKTLSNDEVAASINSAGIPPRPKFRSWVC